MKKLSLVAGVVLLIFLAAPHAAEAGSRFVFSFGIGAPVVVPYGYYGPYPSYYYYPPYPAYYAPYYYSPYYAGSYFGAYGGYYGPRVYRRYPRYGYYRGHVPPGHAYGHYAVRGRGRGRR